MNTLRVLYAIALWTIASVATAAPIIYNFSATDFTPLFCDNSDSEPTAFISGSFELDNETVLGIDLIINGYVYSASEVEFNKDSGMLGASSCALDCISSFTNDFILFFNPDSLVFDAFHYTTPLLGDIWFSTTGSVTVANAQVPEPGSFLLLMLGVCGLLVRFAKPRV